MQSEISSTVIFATGETAALQLPASKPVKVVFRFNPDVRRFKLPDWFEKGRVDQSGQVAAAVTIGEAACEYGVDWLIQG